ncbi:hypothetical protein Syun_025986 [Stephania yunnanensis]|uniref:Uncharacterized protein n=1 Tax=Stephania yunnanensis TaxID=152371 RepID=A0AAP0HW99_9MAGN
MHKKNYQSKSHVNNYKSYMICFKFLISHLKTRLWQVLSQGYGQSMALTPTRSKNQSPTDRATLCKYCKIDQTHDKKNETAKKLSPFTVRKKTVYPTDQYISFEESMIHHEERGSKEMHEPQQ